MSHSETQTLVIRLISSTITDRLCLSHTPVAEGVCVCANWLPVTAQSSATIVLICQQNGDKTVTVKLQ